MRDYIEEDPSDRIMILRAGEYIKSENGMFTAIMQNDGNFVIYQDGYSKALWYTKTTGIYGGYFAFQTDGNLVVYDSSSRARWHSNTSGKGATRLLMQNDGYLAAYNLDNKIVWYVGGIQTK
jgi:hypothetical protein